MKCERCGAPMGRIRVEKTRRNKLGNLRHYYGWKWICPMCTKKQRFLEVYT